MRWRWRDHGSYRGRSLWTFTPRSDGELVGVRVVVRDERFIVELRLRGVVLLSRENDLAKTKILAGCYRARAADSFELLVSSGPLEEMVQVIWFYESERAPEREAAPA